MSSGITVVVTTIAPRRNLLQRALESVWRQTLQPDAVVIAQDNDRRGAPYNRQNGTDCVATEFVAYLDDDDELYPDHLMALRSELRSTADLIYPWFDVYGGADPFPAHEGKEWDYIQVPVTFLARTAAIRAAGGWTNFGRWDESDAGTDRQGHRAGEDYQLVLRMVELGSGIQHLNRRTWRWYHNTGNTSGLPSRVSW